jgi:hypothetical protein
MTRRYTVTEIAEAICQADDLKLADHTRAYSQVRTAVRRNLLADGEIVDARGTLSFPAKEIYRARILNALADYSIDLAVVGEVIDRAIREVRPPHGYAGLWRGFESVIESIERARQNDEPWSLVVSLYRPGFKHGKRLTASIRSESGDRSEAASKIDDTFGTGAPQGRLILDLTVLFANLPSLSDDEG